MTSPIFALCDEYVTRSADLDPVRATMSGIVDETGTRPAGTDYGPDGIAAREELLRETLGRLDELTPQDEDDRRAASLLSERLGVQLAGHEAGEPYRNLSAPFGLVQTVRNSPDLMPKQGDEDWRSIVARLDAIPAMLQSWQQALRLGLAVARRQALEGARQADRYAGRDDAAATYDALLASYGEGRLRAELAEAAGRAHAAFADTARFLRDEYAPRGSERDGVGPDRYALGSRMALGAQIDQHEAYTWGWEELKRLEAEIAAEVERLRPGGTLAEVVAELDATEYVTGADAYAAWLQEHHDAAIAALQGVHIDLDPTLCTVEATLAYGSTAGAPYYTGPSEDLSRPGRTWWPLGGRESFETWRELTTVFHEGVPGHHLQIGTVKATGTKLSRFTRTGGMISGYAEGWALYAERLADELGWFTARGTRLGMLQASAMRAARVVIDIGLHLDLPVPADQAARHGERWSFDVACDVLATRGGIADHRVHPEVVRYCGWHGQAPSYKLGERAWVDAREQARTRQGSAFDLKQWHTNALQLGPIGLGQLTETLAQC